MKSRCKRGLQHHLKNKIERNLGFLAFNRIIKKYPPQSWLNFTEERFNALLHL